MQTDNKMEVMNSVLDEIRAIEKRISVLENLLHAAEKDLDVILSPLFAEQNTITCRLMKEPHFQSIAMMYNTYKSPVYSLVGTGNHCTGYYFDGKNYRSEMKWNDGEGGRNGTLLTEFIDGPVEEREAAVRKYFQSFLDEMEAKRVKENQTEIEKAQALLKSAGLL